MHNSGSLVREHRILILEWVSPLFFSVSAHCKWHTYLSRFSTGKRSVLQFAIKDAKVLIDEYVLCRPNPCGAPLHTHVSLAERALSVGVSLLTS